MIFSKKVTPYVSQDDESRLKGQKYFKNELLMMLEQAGFDEIKVQGDFNFNC